MPTINNIRFQKFDKFSAIFISNEAQETDAYNKLKNYYEKLHSDYPDSFLPIFHSDKHQYSTIRFKILNDFDTLNTNDVVSLNFKIKRASGGKRTVYCELVEVNLIKAALPDDELEFDFD
jgi:hypothetical protein